MKRISSRVQRTLANPCEVSGVGLLSGSAVRLRMFPAAPSTGVVFVRRDQPGMPGIAAHVGQVTGTNRRTTLGHAPVQVTLVEHVLAALAGLRVDNCRIEIDGPEAPGLDGSARGYVEALLTAGIAEQPARRSIWSVEAPIEVRAGGATLTMHPAEKPGLCLTYFLDYGPVAPIHKQVRTVWLTPDTFVRDLSACRTFLLESEAVEIRRCGLGIKTSPADLLVFGRNGPIDNQLRFADEPARHKLLDIVGDLSLFGADLAGHIIAYRSGHPLNVELTRQLSARVAVKNAAA